MRGDALSDFPSNTVKKCILRISNGASFGKTRRTIPLGSSKTKRMIETCGCLLHRIKLKRNEKQMITLSTAFFELRRHPLQVPVVDYAMATASKYGQFLGDTVIRCKSSLH